MIIQHIKRDFLHLNSLNSILIMEFIYQNISNNLTYILKRILYIMNLFDSKFRVFIWLIKIGEKFLNVVNGMNIKNTKLILMNKNGKNAKYIFCVHLFFLSLLKCCNILQRIGIQ